MKVQSFILLKSFWFYLQVLESDIENAFNNILLIAKVNN